MSLSFKLISQDTSEEKVYSFASMIYEKAKSLSKDLEGLEKKKAKEIELSLKVLCKYLKKSA